MEGNREGGPVWRHAVVYQLDYWSGFEWGKARVSGALSRWNWVWAGRGEVVVCVLYWGLWWSFIEDQIYIHSNELQRVNQVPLRFCLSLRWLRLWPFNQPNFELRNPIGLILPHEKRDQVNRPWANINWGVQPYLWQYWIDQTWACLWDMPRLWYTDEYYRAKIWRSESSNL